MLFGLFKKNKIEKYIVGSPMKGKSIKLDEVKDPTFNSGMLGRGIAIIPEQGEVYAPVNGRIDMVFDTHHAVSMTSEEGMEILIHVGLDTVSMKGRGFSSFVKNGDQVKKGDLLLKADLDMIRAEGLDIVTPVLVCNTEEYEKVQGISGINVKRGDDVIKVEKNS